MRRSRGGLREPRVEVEEYSEAMRHVAAERDAFWTRSETTMSVEETYAKFREFFDAAHAPGALDAKTKELIHLAVVLAQHCEP